MDKVQACAHPDLPDASSGYLPYWQLIVAFAAVMNALQNSKTAKLVYNKANVTPLQSRTFGLWTLTSAAIRLAAAYNITNKPVYQLAFASYVFAAGHFLSELLVFRTASLTAATISPMIVSTSSMYWMWSQWGAYV